MSDLDSLLSIYQYVVDVVGDVGTGETSGCDGVTAPGAQGGVLCNALTTRDGGPEGLSASGLCTGGVDTRGMRLSLRRGDA